MDARGSTGPATWEDEVPGAGDGCEETYGASGADGAPREGREVAALWEQALGTF